MPYDGNGNYTLPPAYKATPGTEILTTQHNTPLEDLQAALNAVLLRNGTAPVTANWNMGSNRITFLADGALDTDAANVGQLKKYLALASASPQTVTGPITFSGVTIVSAVTDWTQYQSVPAIQADSRYPKLSGGNVMAGSNIWTGGNTFTSQNAFNVSPLVPNLAALDSSRNAANSAFVTSAVAVETAARIAADALNAKVSGGNSLNGDQQVVGNLRVWNSANAGETLISTGNGLSWIEHLSTRGGAVDAYIALEPSVIATHLGNIAVTSQLPFTDTNLRIQTAVVAHTNGTSSLAVTFPTAFREGTVPVVLPVGSIEGTTNNMALAMLQNPSGNLSVSNTGFSLTFSSGTGISNQQSWVSYIAIGYF
ncbi:MAG: hypothetical protein ABF646_02260 [Acetobacter papayae]